MGGGGLLEKGNYFEPIYLRQNITQHWALTTRTTTMTLTPMPEATAMIQ